MSKKTVLLAGCGDIGLGLGQQLTGLGFSVTGLKRSPHQNAGFAIVQGDLLAPKTLDVLADSYDFIVYTATPSEMTSQAYENIYVKGLNHLLAVTQPRECLLLVSSTGVYHQSKGEWVNESSQTSPTRFSGQWLLKGEQLAFSQCANTTVVRFAGIYGPGRLRLINKVQRGCSVVESPPKYTNRIHRDDCVGMLQFLIEQQLAGKPLASIYIGADHSAAPEHEVLDFIALQLGLSLPVRESVKDPQSVNQNKRCSNERILKLGYQFQYPSYKEGYRQVLQQEKLMA